MLETIGAVTENAAALAPHSIFLPGPAANQPLDEDGTLLFQTPWGWGQRYGVPLTIYHEDTLIALLRLHPESPRGPLDFREARRNEIMSKIVDVDAHLHRVSCRVSDIQRMCAAPIDEENIRHRLDALRDLARATLMLEWYASDEPGQISSGFSAELFTLEWSSGAGDAKVDLEFPRSVAGWLGAQYQHLNWSVRCALTSSVGKAVHRYLSGQPEILRIAAEILRAAIGYTSSHESFVDELSTALEQLVGSGWLKEWEIVGAGHPRTRELIVRR